MKSLKSRKSTVVLAVALAGVLAMGALLVGCGQGGSSASASGSSSASASASASGSSSSSTASSSVSSSASSSQASSSAASSSAGYVDSVEADDPYATGTHHAVLTIEGYDPVTIELDSDSAPVTVSNFCKLANEGYYDGLTFYRFVDGFCMQGGTKGNNAAGQDSSLDNILGEFSGNGVDNTLADDFKKGTVAMARNGYDMNSASSTFFVTLGSGSTVSQSLNGQYGAFGTIDDAGMAVIDQVVADYLPNVTDASMGAIASETDQAKISSIEIVD